MCRMVAKATLSKEPIAYEFLDASHSLFAQSKCGRQPENPAICGPHASGCGLAFVDDGGKIISERRGPAENWDASYQDFVRTVSASLVIGHNRKASPGLKEERSCSHPFTRTFEGQEVAFCHNGTVYTLKEEATLRGVSDSEIFLEQLLSGIKTLSPLEISRQLSALVREFEYSSLSALLLTPSGLFAWRIHSEAPKTAERYSGYYTLYRQSSPERAVIASEPLDGRAGWELLPNGRFCSVGIEAGKVVITESDVKL